MTAKSPNWYQSARLRAIEAIALWRGRVNTRDVRELFGVSRSVAQNDMTQYMDRAPGNLVYNRYAKTFEATSVFNCQITDGDIQDWLHLEPGLSENVLAPRFQLSPTIVRPLSEAVRNGTGLSIAYASMNHPETHQRTVYPHVLVFSGIRWHARAWCSDRLEFRDFVINRMSDAKETGEPRPEQAYPHVDSAWNTKVTIQFVPSGDLSESAKKVIEREYGMRAGRLNVTTRAALVHYTIQAYQADDGSPGKLLQVANPQELAPHLFGQPLQPL